MLSSSLISPSSSSPSSLGERPLEAGVSAVAIPGAAPSTQPYPLVWDPPDNCLPPRLPSFLTDRVGAALPYSDTYSWLCSPTSPHPSPFSPGRRNPVPSPSAPLLLRDPRSSASRERGSGSGSPRDVTSRDTQETRRPVPAIVKNAILIGTCSLSFLSRVCLASLQLTPTSDFGLTYLGAWWGGRACS